MFGMELYSDGPGVHWGIFAHAIIVFVSAFVFAVFPVFFIHRVLQYHTDRKMLPFLVLLPGVLIGFLAGLQCLATLIAFALSKNAVLFALFFIDSFLGAAIAWRMTKSWRQQNGEMYIALLSRKRQNASSTAVQ